MISIVFEHVIDRIISTTENILSQPDVFAVNYGSEFVIFHVNTSIQQFNVVLGTRGISNDAYILFLFKNKSIDLLNFFIYYFVINNNKKIQNIFLFWIYYIFSFIYTLSIYKCYFLTL